MWDYLVWNNKYEWRCFVPSLWSHMDSTNWLAGNSWIPSPLPEFWKPKVFCFGEWCSACGRKGISHWEFQYYLLFWLVLWWLICFDLFWCICNFAIFKLKIIYQMFSQIKRLLQILFGCLEKFIYHDSKNKTGKGVSLAIKPVD